MARRRYDDWGYPIRRARKRARARTWTRTYTEYEGKPRTRKRRRRAIIRRAVAIGYGGLKWAYGKWKEKRAESAKMKPSSERWYEESQKREAQKARMRAQTREKSTTTP